MRSPTTPPIWTMRFPPGCSMQPPSPSTCRPIPGCVGNGRDAVPRRFGARSSFWKHCAGILDSMVTGLVEGTVAAARDAGLRDYRDVRAFQGRLARFTPASSQAARELKGFLHRFVYGTAELDAGRQAATGRIATLFEIFLRAPGSTAPPTMRKRRPPRRCIAWCAITSPG